MKTGKSSPHITSTSTASLFIIAQIGTNAYTRSQHPILFLVSIRMGKIQLFDFTAEKIERRNNSKFMDPRKYDMRIFTLKNLRGFFFRFCFSSLQLQICSLLAFSYLHKSDFPTTLTFFEWKFSIVLGTFTMGKKTFL